MEQLSRRPAVEMTRSIHMGELARRSTEDVEPSRPARSPSARMEELSKPRRPLPPVVACEPPATRPPKARPQSAQLCGRQTPVHVEPPQPVCEAAAESGIKRAARPLSARMVQLSIDRRPWPQLESPPQQPARALSARTLEFVDKLSRHRPLPAAAPASPKKPRSEQGHLSPFMEISDLLLERCAKVLRSPLLASQDVILDVGCGQGKILLELLRQNPTVKGIGIEVVSTLCANSP